MCIIVLDDRVGSQQRVSRDILLRCQETNPDGMGIMWAHDGRLTTWKTLDDFEGIWNRYTHARDHKHRVAIHFRVGTKGTVDLDNCHPFNIAPDFSVMHNGTMSEIVKVVPQGWSDTRYVAHTVLPYLPPTFLNNEGMVVMLKSLLGGDRMVFMDAEGRRSIINEHIGKWEWPEEGNKGVWFSHTRRREYIIEGKEPTKAVVHRVGGEGNNWPSYIDRRSHHERKVEEQKWYDRHEQRGKAVSNKEMKKRRKENVRKTTHGNLLFCYGDWRDDINGLNILPADIKVLGTGLIRGSKLWVVGAPDDNDSPHTSQFHTAGLVTSRHLTDEVLGTIYSLPTTRVRELLEDLDEKQVYMEGHPEWSLAHRRHVPVEMWKGGKVTEVYAWVYFTNEDKQLNNFLHPVLTGDWSDFRKEQPCDEEVGCDISERFRFGGDEWDVGVDRPTEEIRALLPPAKEPTPVIDSGFEPEQCPQCRSSDTLICESNNDIVGYSIYCRYCKATSPMGNILGA